MLLSEILKSFHKQHQKLEKDFEVVVGIKVGPEIVKDIEIKKIMETDNGIRLVIYELGQESV